MCQWLRFHTRSGALTVEKKDDLLVMNFPLLPPVACWNPPEELLEGLGSRPEETHSYMETEGSGNYLAVYGSEAEIRMLPNFAVLERLVGMGVIVTGPGESADFASRYFAPSYGIEEDPVTGSIHCTLVPYWADRLGKKEFHARQVSARSGDLFCELLGRRIGSDTACPAPEPIGRRACTKERLRNNPYPDELSRGWALRKDIA